MKFATIILEAYCGRTWSLKKGKYLYEMTDFKSFKMRRVKNKGYDPSYRTPKKPSYCPMKGGGESPGFICLERNCRHLIFSDADKEEYLWDNKYWNNKGRGK